MTFCTDGEMLKPNFNFRKVNPNSGKTENQQLESQKNAGSWLSRISGNNVTELEKKKGGEMAPVNTIPELQQEVLIVLLGCFHQTLHQILPFLKPKLVYINFNGVATL